MTAGSSAELRIVAVTPTERPVTEPPAAEDVAEDQTDRPVENPPAAETEPETAETQPADAPETAEAPDADADAQPDRVAAVPPTPTPRPAPSATEEQQGGFTWERAPTTEPDADADGEQAPTEPQQTTEQQDPAPQTANASPLAKPYIQAGVFGVRANATKLMKRIRDKGIPVVGRKVNSGGRQLTRVLAGPFQSSAERSAAQQVIRKMGLRDAASVRR